MTTRTHHRATLLGLLAASLIAATVGPTAAWGATPPSLGRQTTLGFTGLKAPQGVAVDSAGNVYAADTGNNRIVELPVDGSQVTLPFTGLNQPASVTVDSAGDVFVADYNNNRVMELPAGGSQITLGFSGLNRPDGVAVDPSGDVFVDDFGNNRVVELPVDGSQVTLGFTGLNGPRGLTVDSSGDVYLADTQNRRVLELPVGRSQTQLVVTGLSLPSGVQVDAAGDAFISDQSTDQIIELAHNGTQTTLPTTGLSAPLALALDTQGDIYVADWGHGRIIELPNLTTPTAPTSVHATPGNSQVTLSWKAPNNGGTPITGYKITPYITGVAQTPVTFESTTTTQVIGGLTNGDSYTFTVAAINAIGTSVASTPSSAVVPVGPPEQPVITSVTGGNGQATLSWTLTSSTANAPATGYIITPYLGATAQTAETFTSTATTETIAGLTNGNTYTFTVTATSSAGTGPASQASPMVLPPFPTLAAFVQQQSQDFLGTSATTAQVNTEIANLNAGDTPGGYILALRRSPDAVTNVDPVTRLYFAYFERIPDVGGLTYWISQARTGRSLYSMSNYFAGSSEFTNTYGSLTNSAFVNLVYENVLGRAPDPSGDAYWVGQLNSGAKTRGQVMVGFSESNEYKVKEQPSVDVAVTWIDMLGVSPDTSDFNTWETNLTTGGDTVADLAAAIMAMPDYSIRVE